MDERRLDEVEDEYYTSLSGKDEWPISESIFERPLTELKKRPWLAVDATEKISVAVRQMVTKKIGSCMATKKGVLVGILTERDLVTQMANNPFDPKTTAVADLMIRKPKTVHADAPVALAIHLMSQGGYRHLPIVDRELRPLGLVSVRDITDYLAVIFPHKILTQPPDPNKIPAEREGG